MEKAPESNSFFADPRLSELSERLKSSNDLFDIISPLENQHSDILRWCFSAKEAHGQGDEILKDFLLAAYQSYTLSGNETGPKTATGKFFNKWTPQKLASTSIGNAFVIREFPIEEPNGRLDLVIVDLQNEFLIVVENKQKARPVVSKFDDYAKSILKVMKPTAKVSEFDTAMILLCYDYPSEAVVEGLKSTWAVVDYDWLKRSAQRARIHLERGNESARLVVAYCESQTQEAVDMRIDTLATGIAASHPDVVKYFRSLRSPKLKKELLKQLGKHDPLAMYALQNTDVTLQLVMSTGVANLRAHVIKNHSDVICRSKKTIIDFLPSETADQFHFDTGKDGVWPLVIRARKLNPSESNAEEPAYRVRVIWNGTGEESSEMLNYAKSIFTEIKGKPPELEKIVRKTTKDKLTEKSAASEIGRLKAIFTKFLD